MECPNCGNTMIGVEYPCGHRDRYDGVSEWKCPYCAIRVGRWTKRRLKDGEAEPRFGVTGVIGGKR